jgi:hypothetical protein
VTTYGACPFFYSISPFPILIFIFAFAKDYIGGVDARLLLLIAVLDGSVLDFVVPVELAPIFI